MSDAQATPGAMPGPASPLRIARPSRDLAAAERFWVHGLGLAVLWRGAEGLLMLGWPTASWHLELVEDPALLAAHPPSAEDLLVVYVGGTVDPAPLLAAGGTRVTARNPYWEKESVTIADPDGYLLVLSGLTWP